MLAAGYVGYLGVPMLGHEEAAHGILAVYHGGRASGEEEAEALHALAANAAAARVNADLYQGVSHEQQRGEAILANVADGIVAVDRDGGSCSGTRPPKRVTGVSQQDALGKTPTEALDGRWTRRVAPSAAAGCCRSGAAARKSGSRSARQP